MRFVVSNQWLLLFWLKMKCFYTLPTYLSLSHSEHVDSLFDSHWLMCWDIRNGILFNAIKADHFVIGLLFLRTTKFIEYHVNSSQIKWWANKILSIALEKCQSISLNISILSYDSNIWISCLEHDIMWTISLNSANPKAFYNRDKELEKGGIKKNEELNIVLII